MRALFDNFKDIRTHMFFNLSDLVDEKKGVFNKCSFDEYMWEECPKLLEEWDEIHEDLNKNTPTISIDFLFDTLEQIITANEDILDNPEITNKIYKTNRSKWDSKFELSYKQVRWIFQAINHIVYIKENEDE